MSDNCHRINGGNGKGEDPDRKHDGKFYDVIYCRDKVSKKSVEQAYRYKTANGWSEAAARAHCDAHNGISFEPATGEQKKHSIDGLIDRSELTTRTYQVRLESLDEKSRSIEAVIATENPILVMDWNRWQVIEEVLLMNGLRVPANGQVPLLDTHDRSTVQKQIGSTRNIRVEGGNLIGRNFYSSSGGAEHAWILTKEGHLSDNSIGYRVINSVNIPKGQKAQVQGRKFQASAVRDLRVTTEWEIGENSVCPIGADEAAKTRDFNLNFERDFIMDEFKKWLKKRGLAFDDLTDSQRDALKADFEAEQKRVEDEKSSKNKKDTKTQENQPPAVSPEESARKAVEAERQRVAEIRKLAGSDCATEVIDRLISEGKSIDQARAEILDEVRKNRPKVSQAPAGIVRDGQIDGQLLADALMLRAGLEAMLVKDKNNGQVRAEKADRIRDIALVDVFRYALLIDGREVPAGREELIRVGFSTPSLPIILGAVANKSLMKGYQDTPSTWQLWCQVAPVPDFKTQTRVRLTDAGDLEVVPNSGEVGYGSAQEEYEQYYISTYAKNFGITRQNIINDDLGAFTKTPQAMGARAARKIGDLVYTHLLANGAMQDGVALFYATTHVNLNTSAALGTSGKLGASITSMAKQTDKDGQPLNIPARFLLVPPDLKFTALELVKSIQIVLAGNTDVVRGSYNPLSDEGLVVVSEARLSNAAYTGNSTTTWYLIGDPNLVDTIEVAFLNGKQTPTLERFDMGPDRMGIVYRISQDVGCKALDWRGMQKNTA